MSGLGESLSSGQGIQAPLTVCRPNLGLVMGVGDKLLAVGKPRRGHTLFGPVPGCTGSARARPMGCWCCWEMLASLAHSSLCVCVSLPSAGMPCLASVPACTLSSAPLLMMSTRSCPSWERLSSPRQGKGTSSVGRKRPSAAGPCKPSRSVHNRCCPTARAEGSGAFVPRTSCRTSWVHDLCLLL